MMCLIDEDRRILEVNRAMEEFTGWPVTEFGSDKACGAFGCVNCIVDENGCGHGPSCGDCDLLAAIQDTIEKGTPHRDVEYTTVIQKNGMRSEYSFLGSTARMPSSHGTQVLLSLMDITQMKVATTELSNSRKRFQDLFLGNPDPIFILDWEGRIVDMNRAARAVLSSMKGHGRISSMMDMVPTDDPHRMDLISLIKSMDGGGKPIEVRFASTTTELRMEVHLTRIAGEEGGHFYQAICHDVTKDRLLEDQMRKRTLRHEIVDGSVYLVKGGCQGPGRDRISCQSILQVPGGGPSKGTYLQIDRSDHQARGRRFDRKDRDRFFHDGKGGGPTRG